MEERCRICKRTEGPFIICEKVHDYKGLHLNLCAHERCITIRYRQLKSGPRKGHWVLKTRRERRQEWAEERKQAEGNERVKLAEYLEMRKSEQREPQHIGKWFEGFGQFIGVYLLLFLPYGVLILVANFLKAHHLPWLMLPILLIDPLGGRLYRRPKGLGKHIPLYWIFRRSGSP